MLSSTRPFERTVRRGYLCSIYSDVVMYGLWPLVLMRTIRSADAYKLKIADILNLVSLNHLRTLHRGYIDDPPFHPNSEIPIKL